MVLIGETRRNMTIKRNGVGYGIHICIGVGGLAYFILYYLLIVFEITAHPVLI